MKFLFGKNYPLWLILLLVGIIVGIIYLHFDYVDSIKTSLAEKGIILINGEPVTSLPFDIVPHLSK